MWKRYNGNEEETYLSVVYKAYGKHYGGYYIAFPEEGDLYIPLYDLGKPEEVKPQTL